ncbi:MAG: cyclic nucleotide-binding domain-containing protein [Desulfobacterales bacterium]|nr:cyclic nucleotide-binding domain-containing protein [Desulfobacterales bacterium]
MNEFIERESLVEQCISENNIEKAVKLLFDLIVFYAKNKNFVKANALREKLIEVDNMALTEIISTGEIIEDEKRGLIDKDHLKLWTPLFSMLNEDEANALYYAMNESNYLPDQTIFKQGESNSNLYFINNGEVKIVYLKNNKETLLKVLSPGHIAGDDSFFSISVCTTSMITLTGAQIDMLSRDVLKKWETEFPALAPKIQDFCLKTQRPKILELVKKKGLERRTQTRTKASGQVMIQLIGSKDEPIGKPFKGDLSDLSIGGVSFYIKTSKKETARLLLGRKMAIKFIVSDDSEKKFIKKGTVVGVGYHLFNDYSIHANFEKEITEMGLLNIISAIGK